MANPNWSTTVRDRIHQRLGYLLGLQRLFTALQNWLHPQNSHYLAILIHGDEAGTQITGMRFRAGQVRLDTDVDGIVYGTITDGVTNTISLYKDQARTTKVAEGEAADNGTATIEPEAGFTLEGEIDLGTISASTSFAFLLLPPPYSRAGVEFNGEEEDDAQNLNAIQDALDAARASLAAPANAIRAAAATVMRTLVARQLAAHTSTGVLLNPGLVRRGTGQIDEAPSGLVEDWRAAQADNDTGSPAPIQAGAATQSAAVAFPGTWTGRAAATPALSKMAVAGRFTGVCRKALDAAGPPEFELVFEPDDVRRKPDDGRSSIPASFRLTMGRTWKEPQLGIESLTIEYAPTVVNDSGASLSTTGTDWTMPQGLTTENSDGGKLWTYYDASDTTLEFYRSEAGRDARDPDELVAVATIAPGDVNTVFTTQQIEEGGLVLTGKTGTGTGGVLVDGDKGSIDYNPPQTTQPAAYFTVTISETAPPSAWVKTVRDGGIGGVRWEPNTGNPPNLDDGWIEGGMPFPHARVFGVPD